MSGWWTCNAIADNTATNCATDASYTYVYHNGAYNTSNAYLIKNNTIYKNELNCFGQHIAKSWHILFQKILQKKMR